MTNDEARLEIGRLKQFITFMDGYQPETFEQKALKLYVEFGSVTKVSEILRNEGYKSPEGKYLEGKVITNLLRSKPQDEMHSLAQDIYKRNKKRRNM
ncbi:hypothetical protein [Planococcus soli]|uniref:hypothetical protein n=1 Tax=Planococcus soli TaxID=2666072 RepID=UPI00115D0454|nr:hypothetical protein [Planococcus soli]